MDTILLTPVEAAKALSVGRSKIYELMGCGALRSVRIGRSRRVSVAAIRDYLTTLDGGDT